MSWRSFVFLLLVPVIPWAQQRLDAGRDDSLMHGRILDAWSPTAIRRIAPGFETLMADIYWMRTVQYFGAELAFRETADFSQLRPLIEMTTALDPRLEIAYRYGAVYLAEPPPSGAGKPDDAIAVLEQGVRANPSSWRLRQDLGYFWYLYKNDARRASAILISASRLPGAPFWLETLAAQVLASGGDRRSAKQVWARMYEQSEPGFMRGNAEIHLMNLEALDVVDAHNLASRHFEARHGRKAASLDELARWSRLPASDPTGTRFSYDSSTGTCAIARSSRAWLPL